jgi:hypothetical protein
VAAAGFRAAALYWILGIGFVVGLAAHVGGFLLWSFLGAVRRVAVVT